MGRRSRRARREVELARSRFLFRSFVITQKSCSVRVHDGSRRDWALVSGTPSSEKLRRFPPVSRSTRRTCRRFTSTTEFHEISVLVRSQVAKFAVTRFISGSFANFLTVSPVSLREIGFPVPPKRRCVFGDPARSEGSSSSAHVSGRVLSVSRRIARYPREPVPDTRREHGIGRYRGGAARRGVRALGS